MTEPVPNGATAPVRFPTMRRNSIALQTVDAIKDMILSGELRRGQLLPSERDFAQALGISRPTLRQAIGALTAMNILESRHGDGTFVTDLSTDRLMAPIDFALQVDPAGITQLFQVRQILEVEAAKLAARTITDGELDAVRRLLAEAERVLDRPAAFADADFRIHRAIARATGNPLYAGICESIGALSMTSRALTAQVDSTRHAAHEHHVAIVEALADHDAIRAGAAMAEHLSFVQRALVSVTMDRGGGGHGSHG